MHLATSHCFLPKSCAQFAWRKCSHWIFAAALALCGTRGPYTRLIMQYFLGMVLFMHCLNSTCELIAAKSSHFVEHSNRPAAGASFHRVLPCQMIQNIHTNLRNRIEQKTWGLFSHWKNNKCYTDEHNALHTFVYIWQGVLFNIDIPLVVVSNSIWFCLRVPVDGNCQMHGAHDRNVLSCFALV